MRIGATYRTSATTVVACTSFLLLIHLASALPAFAQLDVSDVVVQGSPVTRLETVNCISRIDVVDASMFKVNDRVLVHQAKGMEMSQNMGDSGRPISQADCGNFELATVGEIVNNTLILLNVLQRQYDVQGRVQVVRVISSSIVSVNGPLTAVPWNGRSGGIIAIEATDRVVLNTSISADEIGFRGGDVSLHFNSCATSPDMDAAYPSARYGQKGEGGAEVIASRGSGRARLANGGGGGGNHNAGGGGGGNGGSGGMGGAVYGVCGVEVNGGLGGVQTLVDPNRPRLFFGGGGGGGHHNEANGSNGGRGGGIVLIVAPIIEVPVNGVAISSRGENIPRSEHDGPGGGGAGGTIFLATSTTNGAIELNVEGGKGGDIGRAPSFPVGPGGGGAGGHVLLLNPAPQPGMLMRLNGGVNGVNTQHLTGIEHAWYAEPGASGSFTGNCIMDKPVVATPVQLTQISQRDLGIIVRGTGTIVDLTFVNESSSPLVIQNLWFLQNQLRIVGSTPPIPAMLGNLDTLIVQAEVLDGPTGPRVDSLVIQCETVDPCTVEFTFQFVWNQVLVPDSCDLATQIIGEPVAIGQPFPLRAVVTRKDGLPIPGTFSASIRYQNKDLLVGPDQPDLDVVIEKGAQETVVHIDGVWDGGADLFQLETLPLLSENRMTPVVFEFLSVSNGRVNCTVNTESGIVDLKDVCATRRIRSVQFVDQAIQMSTRTGQVFIQIDQAKSDRALLPQTLTIWTLTGSIVYRDEIRSQDSLVELPPGVFVVQIENRSGLVYIGLAHTF